MDQNNPYQPPMSDPHAQQPAGYAPPPPPPEGANVAGIIGFILSLIGCCAVVTAPIGAIVSLFGLKHPRKGFAIAGLILGLIGCLWLIPLTMALMGAGDIGKSIRTGFDMAYIITEIHEQYAPTGAMPTTEEGTAFLDGKADRWGTPYRYEQIAEDSFSITSAGPDMRFDTMDDIEVKQ